MVVGAVVVVGTRVPSRAGRRTVTSGIVWLGGGDSPLFGEVGAGEDVETPDVGDVEDDGAMSVADTEGGVDTDGEPSTAGITACDRAEGDAFWEVAIDGSGVSSVVRAAAATTVPATHTATSAASAPPTRRDFAALAIRLDGLPLCRGRREGTAVTAITAGAGAGLAPTVRAIPAAPRAANNSGRSGT